MKKNDRLSQIPVVMMSADDDMESVAACMTAGAKYYFIKPLKPEVKDHFRIME